jgi:hypothetical protein
MTWRVAACVTLGGPILLRLRSLTGRGNAARSGVRTERQATLPADQDDLPVWQAAGKVPLAPCHGMSGGLAANAVHGPSGVLTGRHDQGRVTLPGLCDGVPELPDAMGAHWPQPGLDPAEVRGDQNLPVPVSQTGPRGGPPER